MIRRPQFGRPGARRKTDTDLERLAAPNAGPAADRHHPKGRWHPGVRLLLALVVLFPAMGMAILTASDTSSQWSSRRNAQTVASEATDLQTVAQARGQLVDVVTALAAVSYAQHVGVNIKTLSALLHTNYSSVIRQSVVDLTDNVTFRSTPPLRADATTLLADVSKVRSGTISFTALSDLSDKFLSDLVNLWMADYNRLEDAVERWQPPGSFEVQVAALRQTFQAFVETGVALESSTLVLTGEGGTAAKQEVIESYSSYNTATQQFAKHLGPKGKAAWLAIQRNGADRNYQGTLREAIQVALGERVAPWASDPALAGPGSTNGLKFLGDVNYLVRADSEDLHLSASAQASDATWDLVKEVISLLLLVGISLGGVAAAGRYLSRPLQKLAGAAKQISDGQFDLEPLSNRGPREVVATNMAFNDMASTLKAVEAKAVALAAEDLSHPELQIPLPGRTGQALQATVDKLAAGIGERERQRHALHEIATHDRLTGLLNRAAIFDFLTNDVAQRRQAGETVAVLFIDLDGLKFLNDTYGHESGDQAIVATADALMETVGAFGMVGRLGGDEFLVVLSGEERRGVRSMADRIGDAVAARSVSTDEVVIPLQCSIGIAFAEHDSGIDPTELVHQADKAMYEAKKAAHASAEQLAAALIHRAPASLAKARGVPM